MLSMPIIMPTHERLNLVGLQDCTLERRHANAGSVIRFLRKHDLMLTITYSGDKP